MRMFRFDIADGVRLADPIGLDCANEHDAKQTADLIARRIAIELEGEGRAVLVIDESGAEIYKAPVRI